MFKENENKRIALAWERFRRIYCANNERIGGLIGYVFMDKIYEYVYQLTNADTPIVGDHFILEISKIQFAKNIGKTDASLRKKDKNGKTTYMLLEEELGFRMDNGYTNRDENGDVIDSKVSTFYVPLHIEKELELV
ncbi:hypothetical protein D7X33_52260, partial [Butyricicoccus sp. 1XD8-22]